MKHRGRVVNLGKESVSYKQSVIDLLYYSLGGRHNIEIFLFDYPNWTVVRSGCHIDSFQLNAVEKRIIYKHLAEER